MKHKVLFLLTIVGLLSFTSNAQRGVRIGYIDTEYILQNVPEFQQASTQLDKKVQQWKVEIEKRLNAVDQKKKELDNERVLLTKELYEERLEDIAFEETEILDYQQKRFGPNGDLIIQKKQLMQPVQDQIFAAVQEIAETKKFDFVFDKSADVVMLYSAERYDISEQVLRTITRTSKRTQAKNKKERKEAEEEELIPEVNEELDERKKAQEDKKADRAKQIEERRKKQQELRDAKKKEAEARRAKILEDREKARQEKLNARKKPSDSSATAKTEKPKDSSATKRTEEPSKATKALDDAKKTRAQLLEEKRQQKLKDREARKKALEERKKKILEARKKAKEQREGTKKQDTTSTKKKDDKEEEENNN
ncbi:OmpH family outer membrane protein [Winogradskyella sp. 3972H.M.0a.05]|uniref:OmpH family outer membrane protein n=1 Tax=Winogradskyella sp. 3972H.M.0a.05 TaxID=2950277 RepID=UPI003390C27D